MTLRLRYLTWKLRALCCVLRRLPAGAFDSDLAVVRAAHEMAINELRDNAAADIFNLIDRVARALA